MGNIYTNLYLLSHTLITALSKIASGLQINHKKTKLLEREKHVTSF